MDVGITMLSLQILGSKAEDLKKQKITHQTNDFSFLGESLAPVDTNSIFDRLNSIAAGKTQFMQQDKADETKKIPNESGSNSFFSMITILLSLLVKLLSAMFGEKQGGQRQQAKKTESEDAQRHTVKHGNSSSEPAPEEKKEVKSGTEAQAPSEKSEGSSENKPAEKTEKTEEVKESKPAEKTEDKTESKPAEEAQKPGETKPAEGVQKPDVVDSKPYISNSKGDNKLSDVFSKEINEKDKKYNYAAYSKTHKPLQQILEEKSKQYGFPADFIWVLGNFESGGNPANQLELDNTYAKGFMSVRGGSADIEENIDQALKARKDGGLQQIIKKVPSGTLREALDVYVNGYTVSGNQWIPRGKAEYTNNIKKQLDRAGKGYLIDIKYP